MTEEPNAHEVPLRLAHVDIDTPAEILAEEKPLASSAAIDKLLKDPIRGKALVSALNEIPIELCKTTEFVVLGELTPLEP